MITSFCLFLSLCLISPESTLKILEFSPFFSSLFKLILSDPFEALNEPKTRILVYWGEESATFQRLCYDSAWIIFIHLLQCIKNSLLPFLMHRNLWIEIVWGHFPWNNLYICCMYVCSVWLWKQHACIWSSLNKLKPIFWSSCNLFFTHYDLTSA